MTDSYWDEPTKVSFSFPGDLEDTCGGEKMEQCVDTLLNQIVQVSGIDEEQIINLHLTAGKIHASNEYAE